MAIETIVRTSPTQANALEITTTGATEDQALADVFAAMLALVTDDPGLQVSLDTNWDALTEIATSTMSFDAGVTPEQLEELRVDVADDLDAIGHDILAPIVYFSGALSVTSTFAPSLLRNQSSLQGVIASVATFAADLDVMNPNAGISETDHDALRQLIHFLDDGPGSGFASGAYKETLPAGSPFPTSETWWASSAKLVKLVELLITRGAGGRPTTEVWQIYSVSGSVLATVTDAISYSGPFETTRTRSTT